MSTLWKLHILWLTLPSTRWYSKRTHLRIRVCISTACFTSWRACRSLDMPFLIDQTTCALPSSAYPRAALPFADSPLPDALLTCWEAFSPGFVFTRLRGCLRGVAEALHTVAGADSDHYQKVPFHLQLAKRRQSFITIPYTTKRYRHSSNGGKEFVERAWTIEAFFGRWLMLGKTMVALLALPAALCLKDCYSPAAGCGSLAFVSAAPG